MCNAYVCIYIYIYILTQEYKKNTLHRQVINIYIYIFRGVSDVGFSIFADTDADFAFQYPRISDADADIIYFIILGL